MRIHSIEAIAVDIPLTRNVGGGTYAVLERSTIVTADRPPIEDGLRDLAPGPGFGLILDEAMIRRYRVN